MAWRLEVALSEADGASGLVLRMRKNASAFIAARPRARDVTTAYQLPLQ